MNSITFQDAITPAGVIAVGAAIMLLVALLKGVLPSLDARVSGALLAFVLSAVFYVITALALPGLGVALDANGYLNIVLCWLGCATSAVGINSGVRHVATVAGKTSAI